MTEEQQGAIQPDDLIRRLVPDPANPEVREFTGFRLGESDRGGFWRLYVARDLNEYLEFRKDDVLDGLQLPDGTTAVWLKPDAKVTRTRSEKAALEFFGGQIRSGFLRRTGFGTLARAAGTGTGTLNPTVCCLTVPRGGGSPV